MTRDRMDVYISREIMIEVQKLSDLEETTVREIVERAILKFLSRPSSSPKEIGKTRKIVRVLLNIIAEKTTIGELRDWAYDNDHTVPDLNSMLQDACIFAEVPRIRIQ